jgi:hypothetical protein
LRAHEAELRQAGVNVAAIGLGDASYARAFRDEAGIEFPLLIDDAGAAYKAAKLGRASLLHLLRRDNMAARRRARARGHRQHKLGKDPLQLGGSFVFGPGNVDRYAHVSRTFGDNAPVEELVAAARR